MQKIIINRCYGGFGLSSECKLLVATRKNGGVEPYIYRLGMADGKEVATRVSREQLLEETDAWVQFYLCGEDYGVSCKECLVEDNSLLRFLYDFDQCKARTDPDLVAAVEELGPERASGYCAELMVVEVPDDVVWDISEYDGIEQVEEAHRSWP